jgi:hypothetical protein
VASTTLALEFMVQNKSILKVANTQSNYLNTKAITLAKHYEKLLGA